MRSFLAGLLACLALAATSPAYATSTAWILECASLGQQAGSSQPQICQLPGVTEQTVDFTSGEAKSSVTNAGTRFVRVICNTRCSIKVGSSPTAVTTNTPLPADAAEYFGVQGGTDKISVIASP